MLYNTQRVSLISCTLVAPGDKYVFPVLRLFASWSCLVSVKGNFCRPHVGCQVLSEFTLELGDCFKTLDPSPSGAAQITPNSEGKRGQPRERFGGHRNLGLWFTYVRERQRETEEDGSEYFLNVLVKLEFSFLNFICLFGCLRSLFWPGASVVVALGLFLHGMGILVPQPGLHLYLPHCKAES